MSAIHYTIHQTTVYTMQSPDDTQTTQIDEKNIRTVWPTIAATGAGRLVGRLADVKFGLGSFLTLGNLAALVTIPISLAVFAWQLMPIVCRRYKLTTRRLIIQKGLTAVDGPEIGLDEFDSIEIEVLPGQAWHHVGELVFLRAGSEVFRLSGVSRPEPFRHLCLETKTAVNSIQNVLCAQAAAR